MGLTYEETLRVGIATASVTALLTVGVQYLVTRYFQRSNEAARYRRERLLDRYADFVAAATLDLDRARTVQAGAALWNDRSDLEVFVRLEEQRHSTRRDLMRLAFQIQLLEDNAQLAVGAQALANGQPYQPFLVPALWG